MLSSNNRKVDSDQLFVDGCLPFLGPEFEGISPILAALFYQVKLPQQLRNLVKVSQRNNHQTNL